MESPGCEEEKYPPLPEPCCGLGRLAVLVRAPTSPASLQPALPSTYLHAAPGAREVIDWQLTMSSG